MIQFNLLPDVKLEYVKANRLKNMIMTIAAVSAAVAVFIFVVLFVTVDVAQKTHLSSLNNSITTKTNQLKSVPNLNEILTVQNQVNALPGLYNQRPVATRLPSYISQLTPPKVQLTQLKIDFTANTISITGKADSLATVNQYVDTIKYTTYQTDSKATSQPAFTNVILSSFNFSSTDGATFTITASFDPNIFSATYPNLTLNIANPTTNRNTDLFTSPQTTNSGSSTH